MKQKLTAIVSGIAVLAIFVTLGLYSCKKNNENNTVNKLNSKAVARTLEEGMTLVLADDNDLQVGHIDGSLNLVYDNLVPLPTFEFDQSEYTITHTGIINDLVGDNTLYLSFAGVSTTDANDKFVVAVPLDVLDDEGNPEVVNNPCPKETHTCRSNSAKPCSSCQFERDPHDCILGCGCNSVGGKCDHSVTTTQGSLSIDFLNYIMSTVSANM